MAENKGAPVGGERRHYFRVDDTVHLTYRVLSAEAYAALREAPPAQQEDGDLVLQLRTLSGQAGALIANIRKSQPDVAQYLSLLDRKVELLARALIGGQSGAEIRADTPVDISAGGVGFPIRERIPPGTPVQVRLVFFPSHLSIVASGEITHCEPNRGDPERPFHVGVEFTVITEPARDALVRHTLERQSALLRERRHRQ